MFLPSVQPWRSMVSKKVLAAVSSSASPMNSTATSGVRAAWANSNRGARAPAARPESRIRLEFIRAILVQSLLSECRRRHARLEAAAVNDDRVELRPALIPIARPRMAVENLPEFNGDVDVVDAQRD